jgi:hypothetical protein
MSSSEYDYPSTADIAEALDTFEAAATHGVDLLSNEAAVATIMAGMKARGCDTVGDLAAQIQTELEEDE